MKAWTALLALGVVVLAAGGAMVVLRLHRTIGLGVVGLGAILVIVGLATLVRSRGGAVASQAKGPASSIQKRSIRNSLIAVAVVVAIGVGTFYGTTYLAGNQSATSTSGTNTPTSSITSGVTYPHTSSGTATSSFSCGANSPILCSSTSTSNSPTQTSSTQNSQSGTSSYPMILSGTAIVTPNGQNETLTGSYSNNGTVTLGVNVFIKTYFSDGTLMLEGNLFYQTLPQVQPGSVLNFSDNMGPFTATGNYSIVFWAVDSSNQTISLTTTVTFTVA